MPQEEDLPVRQPETKAKFREDGILWMLNRTVFHPRGFALGYDPGSHEMTLYGDGKVPWNYAPSMNEIEDELFTNFEKLLETQRNKEV